MLFGAFLWKVSMMARDGLGLGKKKRIPHVQAYVFVLGCMLVFSLLPGGKELEAILGQIKDQPLSVHIIHAILGMRVKTETIAIFSLLTLPWVVPLIAPHVSKLKLGDAEIELRRKVEKINDDIKGSLRDQYYHERILYNLATSLGTRLDMASTRSGIDGQNAVVRVGAKDFPESWILAEIIRLLMIDAGLSVEDGIVWQPTLPTFFDLRSGRIDVYVEYSGVGYMLAGMRTEEYLGAEFERDPYRSMNELNRIYAPWGLAWMEPLGFNNRHELIMLEETSRKYGINSISDLKGHMDKLVFGANREYFLRETTYPRFNRCGLRFDKTVEVDIGDRYSGLFDQDFDVGIGWTTDAQIDARGLFRVKYDEGIPGINQFAMPLCSADLVEEIGDALAPLHRAGEGGRKVGFLSEEEMRELLKQCRFRGGTFSDAVGTARDFIAKRS